MSCMMSSNELLLSLAKYLVANEYSNQFAYMGYANNYSNVANILFRLNAEAYRGRYKDCDVASEIGDIPNWSMLKSKQYDDIDAYNAIEFLIYQCAEKATVNTKRFKSLKKLHDLISCKIISELPEYKNLVWGE